MYSKRAGTRDRDLHAEHLRECYAGGYLDDEALGKRIRQALEAVTQDDLYELIRDLPSQAELHGKKQSPRRLRKAMVGTKDLYDQHPAGVTLPLMALSLLWAIMPSVIFASHHLYNVIPLQAFGIISIVTGILGFFASLVALIAGVD